MRPAVSALYVAIACWLVDSLPSENLHFMRRNFIRVKARQAHERLFLSCGLSAASALKDNVAPLR